MEARVFKNNQNQAIRLPKAVEFPAGVKTVEIIRQGSGLLIKPKHETWDEFFETVTVPNGFFGDRQQPEPQERDEFHD